MPLKYRNVINPWMTVREIRSSVKYIERLLKNLSDDEVSELLGLNRPDRDWSKNK